MPKRTYHVIIVGGAGQWIVDQGGLFSSGLSCGDEFAERNAKHALAETRRRYGVADRITVRAADDTEAARLAQSECDTLNAQPVR